MKANVNVGKEKKTKKKGKSIKLREKGSRREGTKGKREMKE